MKIQANSNKKPVNNKKNPFEKYFEAQNKAGFFDQFFGSDNISNNREDESSYENISPDKIRERKEQKLPQRKEFTIFSSRDYKESHLIPKQVEKLTEDIRKEIALIKRSNKTLIAEVVEIEKHTIQYLPKKSGIYHIRFLETILSFLKILHAKVGEAKTWLTAMQSRKKKRGSLFAIRSKNKGTQYSLSQELATARSVQ